MIQDEFVKQRNRPYTLCLVGQIQNLVFIPRAIRTSIKGKDGALGGREKDNYMNRFALQKILLVVCKEQIKEIKGKKSK